MTKGILLTDEELQEAIQAMDSIPDEMEDDYESN